MNTEQHAHMHGDGESNPAAIAVSATIHCLVGCVIGETIGLILGVSLQWHPLQTAVVATVLAFITGFSLTLIPLVLKEKLSVLNSFKLVWLGESISIGVMELAMNIVDYYAGGMNVQSITDPIFWYSMGLAVIAGFMAGYPVNYYMIKNKIKEMCH